jgi:hypothetical protein
MSDGKLFARVTGRRKTATGVSEKAAKEQPAAAERLSAFAVAHHASTTVVPLLSLFALLGTRKRSPQGVRASCITDVRGQR